MEEHCELHGTAALITLLPTMATVEPDEQDVHLLSALLQLKQLQQASTWHCPLPLVILVPGPEDVDTLKLEEGNSRISRFFVISFFFFLQFYSSYYKEPVVVSYTICMKHS